MAEIIYMPKLSDTMTEGVVAEWTKKIGDKVSSGEVLAEIETDKATMEFESLDDGVLLHIGVEKGKTAPVNAVLAIIGKPASNNSCTKFFQGIPSYPKIISPGSRFRGWFGTTRSTRVVLSGNIVVTGNFLTQMQGNMDVVLGNADAAGNSIPTTVKSVTPASISYP